MSDKITKLPQIRFAGFTDAWEQRKLGEVFEQTSEYVNPKVENLELWSLTVENGLTPKTERYNREFLVKKEDQYKSVLDNEIIYNPMNMTLGAVDLNLTGKKVAVSGYYITMKTTDNYDSKYFGIWLKTPLAIKMYKMFATGSLIERQRVQFPTLSEITTSVPSKDEQVKIGNILKQLDDTITLHQRKLKLLKTTKKSLLQKMFPKDGANVPEIRFAGFTDAWEQRKLGEMLEKVSAPVELEKELMYKQIGIRSHGKGIFYKESVTGESIGNKRVFWVEPDSLILNIVFAWEQAVARTTEKEVGMIASHRFPMYKMKKELLNLDFIVHFFLTPEGKQLLESASPGGAGRNKTLGQKEFESLWLKLPSCDEQLKIGEFINALDNLITLHQRELNAYNKLKESLLQQMFV